MTAASNIFCIVPICVSRREPYIGHHSRRNQPPSSLSFLFPSWPERSLNGRIFSCVCDLQPYAWGLISGIGFMYVNLMVIKSQTDFDRQFKVYSKPPCTCADTCHPSEFQTANSIARPTFSPWCSPVYDDVSDDVSCGSSVRVVVSGDGQEW